MNAFEARPHMPVEGEFAKDCHEPIRKYPGGVELLSLTFAVTARTRSYKRNPRMHNPQLPACQKDPLHITSRAWKEFSSKAPGKPRDNV